MEIILGSTTFFISLSGFLGVVIGLGSWLWRLSARFSKILNRLASLEKGYSELEKNYQQQDKDIEQINRNQIEIKTMLQTMAISVKRIEDKLYK